MGGDWGIPLTKYQLSTYFKSGMYTWLDSFFGTRKSFQNDSIFYFIMTVIGMFINGNLLSKLLLLFVYSFSALSMFVLMKFFKVHYVASLLAGILYICSPIFFNYSIMGWQLVLLAMGLIPLMIVCFIKALHKNSLRYSVLVGLMFALSFLQSQMIFWIPIILFLIGVVYVRDRNSLLIFLKHISVIIIICLLLHVYWWPGLIFFPDRILNSQNVFNSEISIGTSINLSLGNILRGWGSLANYPYEYAYKDKYTLLSFFVPILAFSSLIIKDKHTYKYIFGACLLILFFLTRIDRSIISAIPFSSVIRDFARFTIFTTLGLTVLSTFTIDYLIANKNNLYRWAGFLVILIVIVSFFPFFNNSLYDKPSESDIDMRLRTFEFPQDYTTVEQMLLSDTETTKALYLPMGGYFGYLHDHKFPGSYRGLQDIFAFYSPKPGIIYLTDKSNGFADPVITLLQSLLESQTQKNYELFIDLLQKSSTKYIVVRKKTNIYMEKFIQYAQNSPQVTTVFNSEHIIVFQNNLYSDLFFAPANVVVDTSGELINYFQSSMGNNNTNIVISQPYNHRDPKIMQLPHHTFDVPNILFQKMNPTKYYVQVSDINKDFILTFNEAFHVGWKLYVQNSQFVNQRAYETLRQNPLSENNHMLANTYANSWFVDMNFTCTYYSCSQSSDGSYTIQFIIEFEPQKYYYVGLLISLFTLLLLVSYLMVPVVKKIF